VGLSIYGPGLGVQFHFITLLTPHFVLFQITVLRIPIITTASFLVALVHVIPRTTFAQICDDPIRSLITAATILAPLDLLALAGSRFVAVALVEGAFFERGGLGLGVNGHALAGEQVASFASAQIRIEDGPESEGDNGEKGNEFHSVWKLWLCEMFVPS